MDYSDFNKNDKSRWSTCSVEDFTDQMNANKYVKFLDDNSIKLDRFIKKNIVYSVKTLRVIILKHVANGSVYKYFIIALF
jgi:hypothetical protein